MATAKDKLHHRVRSVLETHADLVVDADAVEQLAWTRLEERGEGADAAAAIDDLDLDAMTLAVACAAGNSAAIRAFESRYFGPARAALHSMGVSHEMQADALAQTHEALFVGSPRSDAEESTGPRILDLVGKGDLGALVKVVAVRRALNLKRKDRGQIADAQDALAEAIADQTSPELGALHTEHRALVKDALSDAVAGLEPEARTLLRLSLLHHLSIDDLGAMHNIHRSTAARRLAKIRDTLATEVRRRLHDALGSSPEELESMLRMAQSRLDISFERLLAPDSG